MSIISSVASKINLTGLVFLSLLMPHQGVVAQSFTNGGFAGPENYGTVAPSWTLSGGSPDLVTIPSGLSTPLTYTAPGAGVSSEGGTFQLIYENTTGSYTEKLKQTVTGFIIGNTYVLTYEEANFGPCYSTSCYTSTGEFIVNISGLAPVTSGNILNVDDPWKNACIVFTATSTTHTIEWEANCLSGVGSGSWLSLDNVQLSTSGGGGSGGAGFSYPDDTLCTSGAVASPTITGISGGTFSVTPAGLTLNATTGDITPSTSTPGTYDITYMPGGCSGDSTLTIEIVDPPSADFEYDPSAYCQDAANPFPDFDTDGDLVADGVGGTFSSTAGLVIDPATGEIDIASSTPGTYTITNTVTASGCSPVVYTFDITINELPDATMSADETVCAGSPFSDIVFDITAGTGPWTVDYTLDGTPLTEGPVASTPHNLAAVAGTYIFTTITDANGCSNTLTSTVVKDINSLESAEFEYNGPYCANDTDPAPDFDTDGDLIADGVGGTFSSTAGLVIDPATGVVDLDASTPGTYTVTNSVTSPGCGVVSFDASITIYEIPDATISGDEQICDGLAFGPVQFDITSGMAPWSIDYTLDGTSFSETPIAATPAIIPATEGTYTAVSITDANGCTNTLSGSVVKEILPVPVLDVIPPQSVCDGKSLGIPGFTCDVPGSTFGWSNTTGTNVGFGLSGSGNISSFIATNSSTAPLTVTVEYVATSADGCISDPETFTVTVNPTPAVSFTTDPVVGCAPVNVTFYNTTVPAGVNCNWDFGDGSSAMDCGSVIHQYQAGTFDVTLTVETAEGCSASETYVDYIIVLPPPVAAFTADPIVTDIDNPDIEFTNQSLNADEYLWDFGDHSATTGIENPSHTYPILPGSYHVTLWTYSNGQTCKDSANLVIIVNDVILFYVPNVFTPDGNGVNEGFKPVFVSGFDPYDYHLTIFNRWGEIIFESYNAAYGWSGTYGNRGLVEDGTYVWQIEFKETMSDKKHKHRGHVTILK